MTTKSRFSKRRRISDKKYGLIVRCFVADITSYQTAKVVGLNRNTTDRYFNLFRSLIVKKQMELRKAVELSNGIEVDESYFGPRRVRGKRGRGASSKVVVLGLLKRNSAVYTEIISNASKKEILPIIKATVKSGADIYTDGWRSYDALAVYGYNHKKVIHEKNEFVKEDTSETHINGVESFWSWTKRRLNKFNGVRKDKFGAYLVESEWRFNHRDDLKKHLRRIILEYSNF